MTNGELVRTRIRELMEENGMTEYRLIQKSGMPSSTVKSILSGKAADPRTGTIAFICRGLQISVKEFYNSDLFGDKMEIG